MCHGADNSICRLQGEMLTLQEDIKQLTQDKGTLTEKHAVELGEYESQLTALRQRTAELQGMVS